MRSKGERPGGTGPAGDLRLIAAAVVNRLFEPEGEQVPPAGRYLDPYHQ